MATGVGAVIISLAILLLFASRNPEQTSPHSTFQGTVASSHVHSMLNLGEPALHPQQLVYDSARDGLWFWTSVITGNGTTYANRVYFYDIAHRQAQSWPIYSGDWSSQLLSGLAIAPNGDVWIGWNKNLVRFDPSNDTAVRYILPAQSRYPLPSDVIGNLPADLGISDLAVDQSGTVWIARYAAQSLTSFSPATATFSEYPLPNNAGDPAKIAVNENGHILFTTNLSVSHPGYLGTIMGDFDVSTHSTILAGQTGHVITATPQGDAYMIGQTSQLLTRLTASERLSSEKQQIAPTFQQIALPFAIDDASVASDNYGRIWVAVAGQPDIARFDPTSGAVIEYQYDAPGVAANPIENLPLGIARVTPAPNAVWLTHIVAMACDKQGNLWYIRAGSGELEEVTP